MKLISNPILLGLLLVTGGEARIGESPLQCQERYGQGRLSGGTLRTSQGNLRIKVTFSEKRAISLTFSGLSSEEDATEILNKNGKGWKLAPDSLAGRWVSTEGHQATYYSGRLFIKSRQALEKEARAEKNVLERF